MRNGQLFLALMVTVLTCGAAAFAIPIPDNVSVTGSLPGLQNEEQVWFCPKDASIILTNHRDFRLGYRQIGIGKGLFDGMVWIDTLIHPDYQIFTHQSDPVMTVNSAGDVIICHLDYRGGLANDDSSHLAFLVTSDCGDTWSGPYTVTDTIGPYFEDKQFITSDRTGGPHDGNVYISWTRFPNPDRIMFARSTDGTQTFEDTIIVGPNHTSTCWGGPYDAGQFSQPLVGKDGAVYVFWQGSHIDSVSCDYCIALRFNKSTDGGVTWQGGRPMWCVDGYNDVDGGIDVYSQPTTDADITAGPHGGNLYLQYRDLNPDPPYDSDIMFSRSLDTGHTWSAPMRVNDDPVGPDMDQFHNWLVVNNDGYLVSIWYDQRTDPSHYKFDVYAAYSYDGGATWTSNHRISSVSIDPNLLLRNTPDATPSDELARAASPMAPLSPMAGKIAEYIGVSCLRDSVVAVWTDTRLGDQDVCSAVWELPLTNPWLIYPLNGETVDATPGLLWATAWKETEDMYDLQIATDAGFTNVILDETVFSNEYDESIAGLTTGLYYWRIKAYRAPGGTPIEATAFSTAGSFYFDAPGALEIQLTKDPDCDYYSTPAEPINEDTLIIGNNGTTALTFDIQIVAPDGLGWLTIDGGTSIPPTTIPQGDPPDTFIIQMDGSGLSYGGYFAGISISHNDPSTTSPRVLPITFYRSEVPQCSGDPVLTTFCVALEVAGYSSYFAHENHHGGMWRYTEMDEDSLFNPIFTGSLLLTNKTRTVQGPDTIVYRDIYSNHPSDFVGTVESLVAYDAAKGDSTVSTGIITRDTAFTVDVEYIFPQETWNCEFVRIKYHISSIAETTVDAIIGVAADFDCGAPPYGFAGYDANYNLVYQQGTENSLTNGYVGGMTYLSCSPAKRLAAQRLSDNVYPNNGFSDGYIYNLMDQAGILVYSGSPEDLFTLVVTDDVSFAPGDAAHRQIALVSSIAGEEGVAEGNLPGDISDLLLTTARAWKDGFGWMFVDYEAMAVIESGTGSISFAATGTHEDGVSGGCCGCGFSFSVTPEPSEGFVDLSYDEECGGLIEFNGVNPGTYEIHLTVEDLCQEQSDEIVFYIEVTGPACFCGGDYPQFGDLTCDQAVNPVDVVYAVNYVYKNQDNRCYPDGWDCPYPLGDVSCDDDFNPLDVVHYVNYVYKNVTPFICNGCD